jgi:hypothetical protein
MTHTCFLYRLWTENNLYIFKQLGKVKGRIFLYVKIIRNSARCQWLTSVILATQEAEIRRIMVWSQPRQIVC